ncbi:MAG: hypothetical protein HY316_01350 [Acidobacteria bacterium]|nr:hypothetical protein [Acidobacteriota bacterium]
MKNKRSSVTQAWRGVVVAAIAYTLWLAPLKPGAQVRDIPAAAAGIPRRSSAEVMERPISLINSAGKLSQTVSTSSPEAQAFYDQGIALLHSYVWVDAARSFHEALRRDPELAMAELGLAKSYANADAWAPAFEHLKKAADLASSGKASPKEAKWITLCQVHFNAIFAPPAERSQKHQIYKDQIEELIAMDPDDPHVWVLRGNAEESRPQGRGQGGGVGSIAFYEASLVHDPDFWPADHYLVHSYENLGNYALAAEHGKKYAEAVPGVPHAQHMYAHVLPRLGRWQEAADQLAKTDRLQRDYFATGILPVEEWHHGHNIHLLGVANLRLGNEEAARKYLKEAFDLPVQGVRDGRFTDPWLEYLIMRGRFEEALAAAWEAEKRPLAAARLIGAVRAAEALIALNRGEEAREAQRRAKTEWEQLSQDSANPVYDYLPGYYQLTHLNVLDAELGLASGEPEAAEQKLIALADRLVNETNFDGWATGLFRLEQIAALADRLGRKELVAALVERMHRIDPGFLSRFQQPGRE